MEFLAFIPLLIWALGFLALGEWINHLRTIDGRGEDNDPESEKAIGAMWWGGCLFWFLIGLMLLYV